MVVQPGNTSSSPNGTGTPALSKLSCSNSSLAGTATDDCSVTLTAPAPSAGLSINLVSSNAAVVVPATVLVGANATSASFSVTVSAVTTAQTATLHATAGSVSQNFTLSLNPPSPILKIDASSVSFGSVTLSTAATQSITLASVGTEPLTISAASVTGTGFTMSGVSFPVTLNPGQSAILNLQFQPTATGTVTGTLSITSNSSSNPKPVISLSGTGTTTAHSVDLSWNAPASSTDPVAGYHVYRSAGGATSYQLMNSTIDTQTAYVDSTVQSGQIYDYTVKSVDAAGVESAPSNVTSVSIP